MRATIERYLSQAFGVAPSIHETPSGSLKARVETADGIYAVEFSREFLDAHDARTVGEFLGSWCIADEMRRLEGLEVSVSTGGVRLDSSN